MKINNNCKATKPTYGILITSQIAILYVLFGQTVMGGAVTYYFGSLTIAQLLMPLICILFCINLFFQQKLIVPCYSWVNLVLLFTMAPGLVAGAQGANQVGLNMIGYWCLQWFIVNSIKDTNTIRYFLWVYLAILLLLTTLSLLAVIGIDCSWFGRSLVKLVYDTPKIYGPFNNPNAFAVLFIPGIAFVICLINESQKKYQRYLSILAGLLLLICLLGTVSRSGILGVSCMMIAYYCFTARAEFKKKIIIAVIAMALAGSFTYAWPFAVQAYVAHEAHSRMLRDKKLSILERVHLLDSGIKIIAKHPAGIGWGNFSEKSKETAVINKDLHNTYLSIMVELGLFAFFTFCVYCILLLKELYISGCKCRKHRSNHSLLGALFATLIGFGVYGLFNTYYISLLLWMCIALALACCQIISSEESNENLS